MFSFFYPFDDFIGLGGRNRSDQLILFTRIKTFFPDIIKPPQDKKKNHRETTYQNKGPRSFWLCDRYWHNDHRFGKSKLEKKMI